MEMSYRSALEALRGAQKPSRGTPAYSRLVNRPAARVVAAAASTRGMTPNQATSISALLSAVAIAAIALAPVRWWSGVAIGLLLISAYVMDSVDGQLARLYGRGSKAGEWLDHTVDSAKTVSLHLAVAVAWFRHPPVDSDLVLLLPLCYAVVATVTFFGLLIVPTLRPSPTGPIGELSEAWWRKYLLLPTDYGFVCVVFLAFGLPAIFLPAYAFLLTANCAALALAMRKWWRELTALDRATGDLGQVGTG